MKKMTKFELKEQAVANFQSALNAAGMQRPTGKDIEKPKYWRGFVKDTSPPIFLRFDVTDNLELEDADNNTFRREIYINGTLFTRNGFADEDYQILASAIERECKSKKIIFNYLDESYDASQDSESSISYINFEATQRLIMN